MTMFRSWNIKGEISSNLHWFWQIVLFPFLITRACWLLVALYAVGNYLPNPTYAKYAERGFYLTHFFPFDIFTRWDAGNYFSIVTQGYSPSSDLRTVYSNIAFFPLYPYLVKSLGWLGLSMPDGYYVAFGVILSNIFFLLAAVLLYKMIIEFFNFSEKTAARTLVFLYVFPTSFIFSSFYTESLFLFLILLAIFAGWKDNWALASISAFFLLLTRSQGLLAWGFLLFFYLERRGWNFRRIKPDILWLFLAPLGLAAHLLYLYRMTGEWLAPFVAMTAWGRANDNPLYNLWQNLSSSYLDVFKIDLLFSLLFIACSIYILIKWPQKSIGLLTLALSVLPIASGLLVSVSRYLLLVFPVFILAGEKIKNENMEKAIMAVLFTLQIVYFAGWVNYYWIV
jgi:Gpi18-like mannosyltransferase